MSNIKYCEQHSKELEGGRCPDCVAEEAAQRGGERRTRGGGSRKARSRGGPPSGYMTAKDLGKPESQAGREPVQEEETPQVQISADEAQIIEEAAVSKKKREEKQEEPKLSLRDLSKALPKQSQQPAAKRPAAPPAAQQEQVVADVPVTVEELMARRAKEHSAREERRARFVMISDHAPKLIAFLDANVFPALAEARASGDKEGEAEERGYIADARKNPLVAAELDAREQAERQKTAMLAAEQSRRADQESFAHLQEYITAEMSDLVSPHGDSPWHEAINALKANPEETRIMPPITLHPGTLVVQEKVNANREPVFATLKEHGAVLGELFMGEVLVDGTGPEPSMFLRVVKQTPNLHYDKHSWRGGGELGVMRVVMHEDRRNRRVTFTFPNESQRAKDRFDAVKVELGFIVSPEYARIVSSEQARKGEERLEEARANHDLTVTELVVEGKVGTCFATGTLTVTVNRGTTNERQEEAYLELALTRGAPEEAEEGRDGRKCDVRVKAYGGTPWVFAGLGGAMVNLEPKLNLEAGKGAVLCWVSNPFMERTKDRGAAIGKSQDLGRFLRQCVLEEARAAKETPTEPEPEAGGSEAPEAAEEKAKVAS